MSENNEKLDAIQENEEAIAFQNEEEGTIKFKFPIGVLIGLGVATLDGAYHIGAFVVKMGVRFGKNIIERIRKDKQNSQEESEVCQESNVEEADET